MTEFGKDGPVQQLTASVQRLTGRVEDNAAATHRLADRVRRHRLLLVLTIIGLTLDLALSGLFIYQRWQQSCTNSQLKQRQSINQRTFHAEYDKVAGQVHGLRLIQQGSRAGDQAVTLAGFNQFINASEHYLTVIAAINRDVKAHPIGTC